MTLSEIKNMLDANIFTGDKLLETDVSIAYSSDLMSEVLALAKPGSLLLTGLVNAQVIRTCEKINIRCVIFVRGKIPTQEMIDLAEKKDMLILNCKQTMYKASGLLYAGGLAGDDAL